ncbi:MAG: endonuclease [Prevotellaceae bacterium]|jgi:endonuclease/exonuclease/phosphatase family metal-dependent hydrolase|nr:endonuclease [Prevotellaceae bacterium]
MKKMVVIIALLLSQVCGAQKRETDVVFWNVENFYGPFANAPDPAFSPTGANHWTWRRFVTKRDAIAKTLIAIGTDELPVLVGLCEVESRFVLEQLARQTPLISAGYRIVHRDGPDERGLEVALLYRSDRFMVLRSYFLTVPLPDPTQHTREILYTKGVLDNLDTLHLFVNHWPSKRGGAKVSLVRRMAASNRLRVSVDSIFNLNPFANIVVMGDFNDTPLSKAVKALCKGGKPLYNLTIPLARKKMGTLRYRGRWELIDQIIVSENLLNTEEPICTSVAHFSIFSAPFLLIRDDKYLGMKPFRTYLGPRYQGGVSDHLPVVLRIERNY